MMGRISGLGSLNTITFQGLQAKNTIKRGCGILRPQDVVANAVVSLNAPVMSSEVEAPGEVTCRLHRGISSTEPVVSEVGGLGMTPMGWILENTKLSIHNDFRDAPHAQGIAVNPAIEKHDP
jgi:hypothetical protein